MPSATAASPAFTPFSILCPVGMLGYGFSAAHFWSGVSTHRPAAIIIDAGSTDPGPYLLGTGQTLCSRSSVTRDMEPMLEAAVHWGCKVLVSSAGGAGTDKQTDELAEIVREILDRRGWKLRVATVYAGVDKAIVLDKLGKGLVTPCGRGPPPLTQEDVEQSTEIVAQLGAEPFLRALADPSTQVILAGRSYDPSPFAAFALSQGCTPSASWHMGKILECGALCALPKGRTIVATFEQPGSFVLTPANPEERCTPVSVAAHTLYEKSRPDQLPGQRHTYVPLADGRSVRVSGSHFIPSPSYQVKLESARPLGFRAIFIGGVRDPVLIGRIDQFLDDCKRRTMETGFPGEKGVEVAWKIYGKGAVMGPLEREDAVPLEIGILGEVTAPTQEKALAICGFLRVAVLHGSYPNQAATGGNLALPITPLDTAVGPVFKFAAYHLMDVHEEFEEWGKLTVEEMGRETVEGKVNERKVEELQPVLLPPLVPKTVPSGPAPLSDLARIIRSKNAGPFELTFDVLFDDHATFSRVRSSGVLSNEQVVSLYRLDGAEKIVTNMFFEPALAWKCTILRPWPQGSVGERDTFGTQQHVPLLNLIIPA